MSCRETAFCSSVIRCQCFSEPVLRALNLISAPLHFFPLLDGAGDLKRAAVRCYPSSCAAVEGTGVGYLFTVN
jgi:hypothetical protein